MIATVRSTIQGVPDGFAALAYRTGAWVASRLPVPLAHATGRFAGVLCWAMQPSRRRTVRNNLSGHWNDPRRWGSSRAALRIFAGFGESVVDTLRLAYLDREEIARRVAVPDESVLRTCLAERGAVLVGLHTANWEWAGAGLAARGLPVRAVARRHTPRVERFFQSFRSRFGVQTLDRLEESGNDDGGLLAVFADRSTDSPRLRGLRRAARGAASVAARRRADLIPAWVRQDGRGRYAIALGPRLRPDGTSRSRTESADRAVAYLMARLRLDPGAWFTFEEIESP